MVKGNLTEVRDLGMMVNRHNSNELVDHCILKFRTKEGEEYLTHPLPKTCHASSKLGKIIRTLLKRNLTKDDYITDEDGNELFDSKVLLKKTAYMEIGVNNRIIGIEEG
jgi:hypothetical protein